MGIFKSDPTKKGSFISEFLSVAIVIYVIRSMIVNWYVVPSGSMLPTINLGDFIFTNRLAYGFNLPWPLPQNRVVSWSQPERGDIVVFEGPDEATSWTGKDAWVKRVIGLPGDKIEFIDGVLHVNGESYELNYLRCPSINAGIPKTERPDQLNLFVEKGPNLEPHYIARNSLRPASFDKNSWEVPEGKLFVMGDNRDASDDSRGKVQFLVMGKVWGKAHFILWSKVPNELKLRLSRTFNGLYGEPLSEDSSDCKE